MAQSTTSTLAWLLVVAAFLAGMASAAERRIVTVQQLIEAGHQLEVAPGTEVFWGDPHFDRIWFPPASGLRVIPTDAGRSTLFRTAGRYAGRFTIVGGHNVSDVYPLIVIVKGPMR